MTNDKDTYRDPWKTPFNPAPEQEAPAAPTRRRAQLLALEIQDADDGGDPYNHTGSFAVPDFERD